MNTAENKGIKRSTIVAVSAVVAILILGGGWWWYNRTQQEIENLRESFQLEKEIDELSQQWDQISLQYEGFNFKVGNDSLLAMLATEQAKVQQLMDELRTVKTTNAKQINDLKKEIETLRKIMRNYVVQIDSLSAANEQLKKEKNQAVQRYQSVRTEAEKLSKELELQTERVTLASRLDALGIAVVPINARGKEVKQIKQMTQFAVSFRISKNITAPVGEKTIYVRLKRPDDDVLVKNRANAFLFEGREINYSMKKTIEYDGEEQAVTLYWDIEEFLSPGVYRVDIFADGNLIGKKDFELSGK
ncbi:MAG: hypothetical protein LBD21_10405 [Tannerellaceae bacterium]|jgi:CHASE3 domain sensor protein|nr:hypothetical protein [Tannerellaceae bacterium]